MNSQQNYKQKMTQNDFIQKCTTSTHSKANLKLLTYQNMDLEKTSNTKRK